MSVSEAFELPDQPSSGLVEFVPLGGDGFTAPKFAYNVLSAAVTMDNTGGTASISIEMDPRFSSLVSFVTGQILQVTPADSEFLFFLQGDKVPLQLLQGDVTNTVLSTSEIGLTWRPAPVILPGGTTPNTPSLIVRFPNTDGDTARANCLIFCFDIRVRELTPMGPILWARGDT